MRLDSFSVLSPIHKLGGKYYMDIKRIVLVWGFGLIHLKICIIREAL